MSDLGRSQLDLVEISLDLTKSVEISIGSSKFCLKKNDFDGFFHYGRPDQNRPLFDANPTAPIRLSRLSTVGLTFLHPIPLGWSQIGHRPDLD